MIKRTDGAYYLAGGWRATLDGELLKPIWNSKGAAEAGIDVERRRKEKKLKQSKQL